jgi:hypothetical protein
MNYPSANAGQFAASWVENLELARSRPHRRALFRRRRLFSSRPSLCVPIGHRPLRTTLCFPGSSRLPLMLASTSYSACGSENGSPNRPKLISLLALSSLSREASFRFGITTRPVGSSQSFSGHALIIARSLKTGANDTRNKLDFRHGRPILCRR